MHPRCLAVLGRLKNSHISPTEAGWVALLDDDGPGAWCWWSKLGYPIDNPRSFVHEGNQLGWKMCCSFPINRLKVSFKKEMWIFPKTKYFQLAQAQARKYLFSFPSWVSAEDPNTTGTRRWAPRNGTHLCNKGRKKVLRRLGNVWNWWERPFLNPLVHHEKKLWKTVG